LAGAVKCNVHIAGRISCRNRWNVCGRRSRDVACYLAIPIPIP
jgi:hypothetical protein